MMSTLRPIALFVLFIALHAAGQTDLHLDIFPDLAQREIRQMDVSPDQKHFLVVSDNGIDVYEFKTAKSVKFFDFTDAYPSPFAAHFSSNDSIIFKIGSPDYGDTCFHQHYKLAWEKKRSDTTFLDRSLFSRTSSYTLKRDSFWIHRGQDTLLTMGQDGGRQALFARYAATPDQRFFAYALDDYDNEVKLLDLKTGKTVWTYTDVDSGDFIFDLTDNLFVVQHYDNIHFFELDSFKFLFEVDISDLDDEIIADLKDLYLLSDSQMLIGSYAYGYEAHRMLYFNPFAYIEHRNRIDPSYSLTGRKQREGMSVMTQRWHSNKSYENVTLLLSENCIVSYTDNELYTWDPIHFRRMAEYSFPSEVYSVHLTHSGRYVVVEAFATGSYFIIDLLTDQKHVIHEDSYDFPYFIHSISSSPDDDYLVLNTGQEALIYSLKTHKISKKIRYNTYDFRTGLTGALPYITQIGDKNYLPLRSDMDSLFIIDLDNGFDAASIELTENTQLVQNSPDLIYRFERKTISAFDYETMRFLPIYTDTGIIRSVQQLDQDLFYLIVDGADSAQEAATICKLIDTKANTSRAIFVTARQEKLENLPLYILGRDRILFPNKGKMEIYDLETLLKIDQVQSLRGDYGNEQLSASLYKQDQFIQTGNGMLDLSGAFYAPNGLANALFPLSANTALSLYGEDDYSSNGLMLISPNGDTLRKTLHMDNDFWDPIISKDRKYALTNCAYKPYSYLWDLSKLKVIKEIEKAEYSDDPILTDNLVVFKNKKDKMEFYDLNSQKSTVSRTFEKDILEELCVGPEANTIFFGSKVVHLFDYKTDMWQEGIFHHGSYIRKMTYDKGSQLLFCGLETGEIYVWDWQSKALKYRLWSHSASIDDLLVDGDQLISAASDQTIKFWDLSAGTLTMSFYEAFIDGANRYCYIDPTNNYKSTQSMGELLHFVKESKVYDFEQFDLQHNQPGLILEKLGYADISLIKAYKRAHIKRLKKMGFDPDNDGEMGLPQLEIVDRSQIPRITQETSVHIPVQAFDSNHQLSHIQVWLNDVPIFGRQGKAVIGQTISTTIEVPLPKGDNTIQLAAVNDKGSESYKERLKISCEAGADTPNLYILTIGVSQYLDSNYNLRYAAKDAKDIAAAFGKTRYYKKVYQKVFTDQAVTLENLPAMRAFLEQAGINDQVIVFVAGHGVLDDALNYYYAAHNMDFNAPAKGGIPYASIEGLMDGLKCIRKLLFMDTCHSGEVDKEDVLALKGKKEKGSDGLMVRAARVRKLKSKEEQLGLVQTSELMKEMFTDLRTGTGATVISAAGGLEFALESGQWQNGLFTYCLLNLMTSYSLQLEADEDNDGQITLLELQNALFFEVVERSHGLQQPTSRIVNDKLNYKIF